MSMRAYVNDPSCLATLAIIYSVLRGDRSQWLGDIISNYAPEEWSIAIRDRRPGDLFDMKGGVCFLAKLDEGRFAKDLFDKELFNIALGGSARKTIESLEHMERESQSLLTMISNRVPADDAIRDTKEYILLKRKRKFYTECAVYLKSFGPEESEAAAQSVLFR